MDTPHTMSEMLRIFDVILSMLYNMQSNCRWFETERRLFDVTLLTNDNTNRLRAETVENYRHRAQVNTGLDNGLAPNMPKAVI